MSKKDNIEIRIDDSKPNLKKAMAENPSKAREVIGTFVEMMEHAFKDGWADLPKQFHPDLTFKGMIHDILHGVLDLKDIDPTYYKDLGVMVHPFGLFSYQMPDLNSVHGGNYYDWQRHFDWKEGRDLPAIQSILRKLLYYARYIEMDKLGEAMFRKDMDLYLVERDPSPLIAVHPAVQYQKRTMGERFAGRFIDTHGLFDCGTMTRKQKLEGCPACTTGHLREFPGDVIGCERCGAGFKIG